MAQEVLLALPTTVLLTYRLDKYKRSQRSSCGEPRRATTCAHAGYVSSKWKLTRWCARARGATRLRVDRKKEPYAYAPRCPIATHKLPRKEARAPRACGCRGVGGDLRATRNDANTTTPQPTATTPDRAQAQISHDVLVTNHNSYLFQLSNGKSLFVKDSIVTSQ